MKCNEIQGQLIDYTEGALNDSDNETIKQHIENCDECKAELGKLQQIIDILEKETDSILVPNYFMSNVRKKVEKSKENKKKKYRRRLTSGLVASLLLTISVGTAVATNGFSTFFDMWRDASDNEIEKIEQLAVEGLAEQVNLEAVSNDVKVKITAVAADNIQTLIYYEVEDLKKENKYDIDIWEGSEFTLKEPAWYVKPAESSKGLYSEDKHIYKGNIGMIPLNTDEGVLKINIKKLEKMQGAPGDEETPEHFLAGSGDYLEGNWQFELPVKKHQAIEYELNKKTEIDGTIVYFDKLIIAPTVTKLSYRIQNEDPANPVNSVQISGIESNGKYVNNEEMTIGGGNYNIYERYANMQASFDSIYFDNPKNIRIHLGTTYSFIQQPAEFTIDSTKKFPQTYDYLGNKITIESMEIGKSTKVVVTEELSENRTYETLFYHFYDQSGNDPYMINYSPREGFYIDELGNKYNDNTDFYFLRDLKYPKFYSTKRVMELSPSSGEENFIPAKIKIEGYSITNHFDKTFDIELN